MMKSDTLKFPVCENKVHLNGLLYIINDNMPSSEGCIHHHINNRGIYLFTVCVLLFVKSRCIIANTCCKLREGNFLNIFYWEKVIYVTFVFVCETYVILGLGVMMYLFVTEKKSGNFFVFCRKH